MDQHIEWIVVEDGQVFEGTPAQWQDCFFDNAYESVIRDFCKQHGWKVVFTFKETNL